MTPEGRSCKPLSYNTRMALAGQPGGAAAYLDDVLAKLRRHLEQALAGDTEAMHEVRVMIRRLGAARDLFEPATVGVDWKSVGQPLRRLHKAMGRVREIDVLMNQLLTCEEAKAFPKATPWVLDQLAQRRVNSKAQPDNHIDQAWICRALKRWDRARDQIAALPLPRFESVLRSSLICQVDQFARNADLAARLFGTNQPAPPRTDALFFDPHDLRIAGKLLRYSLDISVAAGLPIRGDPMEHLKRMQVELGRWHDLHVLAETITQLATDDAARRDADLQRELAALAAKLGAMTRPHLAEFAALWQKWGGQIRSAILGA